MRSGFLGRGIGPMALKRRRAAASDWWPVAGQTCVAAYQPIGAASLAASYVNLASPGTYDAAPGVAPTLAAGGWSFNGSTQYLTTGVTPANGWSMLVCFSGFPLTGSNVICGSRTNVATNSRFFLGGIDVVGANNMHYAHGQISGASPRIAAGVIGIAGAQGYCNGVAVGAAIGAANDTFAVIFVGASNQSGALVFFSACNVLALAIYSTTLSAADVAALTTRMQALA